MNIRNGWVLRGEDNRFVSAKLCVAEGKIAAFSAQGGSEEDFDATGLYVIPGFIDTHNHGSVDVEFAEADEDFEKARRWLAAQGITGVAPTIRAMPLEEIEAAQRNVRREAGKASRGAKILGMHLEGPFISYHRSGAMVPPRIDCTPESVRRLAAAGGGLPMLMTMAPERENALAAIRAAKECGVAVSLGHSEATYEQCEEAIEAGAVRATHVFNAMKPLYHRETGILGAVLTDDRVTCETICDLVHLDAAILRLIYRQKGPDRITLISDSGRMSGLGDGEYMVGSGLRTVKDGVCLNQEGRIAGSCVSMLAGAKNLLKLGIPLEEISLMGARNPARALGIEALTGSLEIGKAADIVVCDGKLDIKAVFVNGNRVFQAEAERV